MAIDVRKWRGSELTRVREKRGWSILELAVKTGIHPDTLKGWEEGKHIPTTRSFSKLTKALGVPSWCFVDLTPATATLADLRVHAGYTRAQVSQVLFPDGKKSLRLYSIEHGKTTIHEHEIYVLAEMYGYPVSVIAAAAQRSKEAKDNEC